MGLWDKIDETKDELTEGVRENVGQRPLDQAQSGLLILIGVLIMWVSTGYFPFHGFSFHISSILNFGIGFVIALMGFIWYGLFYA